MKLKCDILCIGSNCTRNYGDRAIYNVLRKALKERAGLRTKRYPLKPIHANRHGAEMAGPMKLLHGLAILPRHYFKLWCRARRSRAVVIGGGNLLHDVYPLTALQVFLCALTTRLSLRRFVIFGVGAGPIDRWWTRILIGLACRMSSSTTVRDSYSKGVLERCPFVGAKLNERRCRDVVFSVDRLHPKTPSEKFRVSFSTMMFMHPERWPGGDTAGYQQHIQRCCDLVRGLVEAFQAEVVLFSNEPSEDQSTVDAVLENVGELPGVSSVHCTGIDSAMRIAADADVHVGSRLHSLIFALTQGTPAVALASHGRMRGLFDDLDASDICFEIGAFQPQEIVQAVASLREERGSQLLKSVNGFKQEIDASLDTFATHLLRLTGCEAPESAEAEAQTPIAS